MFWYMGSSGSIGYTIRNLLFGKWRRERDGGVVVSLCFGDFGWVSEIGCSKLDFLSISEVLIIRTEDASGVLAAEYL